MESTGDVANTGWCWHVDGADVAPALAADVALSADMAVAGDVTIIVSMAEAMA